MATASPAQSRAYSEYTRLLRELHALNSQGKGDTEEADTIRDAMDGPWAALTHEEAELARDFSAGLNTMGQGDETGPLEKKEYDYVIVGSGAGGGPLAVNLARGGFSVLVLEAGGDPVTGGRSYDYRKPEQGIPKAGEKAHEYSYAIPAMHPGATRDPTYRWDFFVKHYTDPARQQLDSKYDKDGQGIWYPRAGTLGGCTAHNAMITVYPHNSDWDRLAATLGDPAWNSQNMRGYFDRVIAWLGSSSADPRLAVDSGDLQLLRVVASAAAQALLEEIDDPLGWIERLLARIEAVLDKVDPLAQQTVDLVKTFVTIAQEARQASPVVSALLAPQTQLFKQLQEHLVDLYQMLGPKLNPNELWSRATHDEGLFTIPMAVKNGRRSSVRDHLLATAQDPHFGPNLTIETQALASRVLFGAENTAIGVEYYQGDRLYQADPSKPRPPSENDRKTVFARREVILSGGTYNTPQLLMLSGIGPKAQLAKFGIDCRVALDGVGANLHDRYEVGVVSEMTEPFKLIAGAKFVPPKPGEEADDPVFLQWRDQHSGVYSTNGSVISILRKSDKARADGADPDLFIFGLPGYFKGYFPAYAELVEEDHQHFTWAILKAHTRNRAGTVSLTSDKPWERPEINFRYFDEGSPGWEDDLEAVADGLRFVLKMVKHTGKLVKTAFVYKPPAAGEAPVPGAPLNVDDPASVREYIKREAWGHHACGTCKLGPTSADEPVRDGDPDRAVLDHAFRVRGTKNLRVVDASVFPDIPGFFIVAAVYMVSEKASDAIARDADKAQALNVRARGAGGQ